MAAHADGRQAALQRAAQQALLAGRVLQELPGRVHPGWVATVGADPQVLAEGGGELLNTALLHRFDLRWPDLSAAVCALENAWLLPPADIRRLCCARAIFAWRATLARTVDAGLRRRARAAIGDATFAVAVGEPAVRRSDTAPPPLADGDAPALPGWALLKQAQPWRDPRAQRLIELMLPPAAAQEPAPAAAADAGEHGRFLALLPRLFPEHAWLFGSEPAPSMSA